jgi:large subunit ribosomal protein L9
MVATESHKKMLAELKKHQAYKEEKIKKEAETIAQALEGTELKVAVKASSTGKIFGSVNNIMVANAIKDQKKLEVDRKIIELDEDHIKEVGKHKAKIKLHREIVVEIDLDVVAE